MFGVIAEFFRVGDAIFLIAFSSLLKLSLHAPDLFLKNIFRDVEVISEFFPRNLLHLVLVGESCKFFLNFLFIFFLKGF
jgi:hypothetical protein